MEKDDESALRKLIEMDEFRFSENLDRKTESLVFDRRTVSTVYEMMKQWNIRMIDFPISTGKEASVFRASGNGKFYIFKIYKTATLKFNKIYDYINGDPRFENEKKSRNNIINIWVRKEFVNLRTAREEKLNVPEPFKAFRNVIMMSYIGTKNRAAPILKDVKKDVEQYFFSAVDQYIKLVFECGIVHADLSEYNILCHRKKAYLIDLGQGLSIKHPNAKYFYERDISNMKNFARKYEIDLRENTFPKFGEDMLTGDEDGR